MANRRALEPYRKAIKHREALVHQSPENIKWQGDCGSSWFRLGEALEALGQITEAIEAHRTAVAHQRQVCAREPGQILLGVTQLVGRRYCPNVHRPE